MDVGWSKDHLCYHNKIGKVYCSVKIWQKSAFHSLHLPPFFGDGLVGFNLIHFGDYWIFFICTTPLKCSL